jgi:multidrug efflux pump subunit AcrA (membrane-fusion protein)
MLIEEYAAQLVPVEVTAVHEHGIDFKTEDGARYIDWRAKIYDQYENELPLDDVRREFELEEKERNVNARVAALEAELAAYEAAYAQGVNEA